MASHVGAATSAPAFCVVHDADESSCLVCWAPVAGAKTYELQMRRVDGAYAPDKETAGADGFWMTLHTCEWTTLAGSLTSTRARKKGLDEDAAYEFRASVSRRQSYAWSPVATLAPRAGMSRLAAPVVEAVDGDAATVAWTGGEAPYALQVADEADEPPCWKLVATVAGTRARKKNLPPGGRVQFRVRPAEAAGWAWSPASAAAKVPRLAPFLGQLFGPSLVDAAGGARSTAAALAGKLVAVYASAAW
mmetsp:Transcript_21572/g.66260  ORF Transcript_21572/g.66260 Transcript_21572/m.66260 type:complete len:248 (-) Transcript_21572:433-1176(-)